jgi:MFS transporter, ACS family, D-galactonate transporter
MAREFAMARAADESQRLGPFASGLGLLVICVLINYVDRGNISVAGPLLKQELGLSASQLGILFAAFFSTYTAMQFVVGWLVDRFDVNRILAAGFLIWSLATAATGVVRGFTMLLAMRLILGIGESVAFPSCVKILGQQVPEHHRGFANGALSLGVRYGIAAGTFSSGMLMARFGWRPVFIWIGLVSLLWLPAWRKWMPRGGSVTVHTVAALPGSMGIFRQRSFWGACTGHFCSNYIGYFMMTWLPGYLVLERHLSMATMARIASLYFLVCGTAAMLFGGLQDFSIRKGFSPTLIRKSAMAIGCTIAAITIGGIANAGSNTYLPWLLATGVGFGMIDPGNMAFAQTLAGTQVIGRWYGAQNGFANTAGVIAPALTGFLLQWTGNFRAPFAVTATLCLAGGLAWVFLVGRVEQVSWAPERRGSPAATVGGV